MMNSQKQQTVRVYEDPEVVEGFIQKNAFQRKNEKKIRTFSKKIQGKKVLDLGCGPGQDSYLFAELGFDVIGLDFSKEMIRRAKTLKKIKNSPLFMVGDMKKLSKYFADNTFDAVWASASLVHLDYGEVMDTLHGIHTVSKKNAKIFISLKMGIGEKLVTENKYGKTISRKFTLWTKESFSKLLFSSNWEREHIVQREGSSFLGLPVQWLEFFLTVKK